MFDKKNCKVPLDKFIHNALYHPKKGYYMKKIPFGKNGDFITAPNISKLFSEMIFLWLISYWNNFYINKKINIVELGAGNGEMLNHIISSSKKFENFFSNCNFIIYEKSKKLIKLQKKNLKNYKVVWIKNFNKINKNPTIFVGNEFLDALPIKQFLNKNNQWHERYVQKKGELYNYIDIKSNINNIEEKLNLKISKRNFIEISLEQVEIIKKINKIISKKGGCMLFIDYAYSNNEIFNTLQAVKKHRKVDVLKEVGNSDITHLINIPFLKKILKKFNLKLNYNTQRDFLLKLGILKRAEILSANKSFLDKANIYYRINRLIDKTQMGELFKVIYIYKKNNKFSLGFE